MGKIMCIKEKNNIKLKGARHNIKEHREKKNDYEKAERNVLLYARI